jgi:NAD kinase
MSTFEKIVLVTKKTALEELIERFNTRGQARFYIESLGEPFDEYEAAHEAYHRALVYLREHIPRGTRTQILERGLVPTYTFGEDDLIVTLGPDGLVVNVAKYLNGQPLIAFNPDPARIDGVLLPFHYYRCANLLPRVIQGQVQTRRVTMAQAVLNDGQRLLAVNDLFIGAASHISARYRITWNKEQETQSSSGLIVSTGAGSTGWLRSIVTGATRIAAQSRGQEDLSEPEYRFSLDAKQLVFSVREPFESRTTNTRLVFGRIHSYSELEVASLMPQNGVIFSDGIESDYVAFNSGAVAKVSLAPETLALVSDA